MPLMKASSNLPPLFFFVVNQKVLVNMSNVPTLSFFIFRSRFDARSFETKSYSSETHAQWPLEVMESFPSEEKMMASSLN